LNARAGSPVVVGELLFQVVREALEAAAATDGAFDPTLLSQLLRAGYDRSFEHLPDVVDAPSARPSLGGAWRDVELDARSRIVTLPAGSGLDLGGIAKGLAVDASLALLAESGVPAGLVSAGGDLAVCGLPPGESAWQVLVGESRGEVVALERGALATSGVARRSWRQGDRMRHHLIDPTTGESAASGLREVTVAASTCAQAEVAATAAFVLGPARGAELLRRNGLAGRLTLLDDTFRRVDPWPVGQPVAA
jgi:thiamine biosynthesis lipoprotein